MGQHIWCAFTDPDRPRDQQFLGVTIVTVPSPMDESDSALKAVYMNALQKCWQLNANPGGQVEFSMMEERLAAILPSEFVNRLLREADILRLQDALRDMLE